MSSSESSISLYDTTLRDGAQGEGIHFSLADKLRIAQRLDSFGMHYIEGGWPGSNEKDIEFFREAARLKFKHAKLCAFGSTRKPISVGGTLTSIHVSTPGSFPKPISGKELAASDPQVRLLLEAGTSAITLVCKASSLHVKEILKTTLGENRAMIRDTVALLVQHGREVIFDGEHTFDGYKLNPEYTCECVFLRLQTLARLTLSFATQTEEHCQQKSSLSPKASEHI